MLSEDLLDLEVFVCCKCGVEFKHTDGTWVPIGIKNKSSPVIDGEFPTVISWLDWFKPPEIITSDEFTCYNCTP